MQESRPYTSPQSDDEAVVLDDSGCTLVLHNDDVHTFDYVIKALSDICRISAAQAEQCAILVHCHGKCNVKHGSYETLLPMHTALLDKQLTSEIVQI
ncbi:MAG: ATP-dependent Clp protease adaptor ClpS [Bacteroidales bacterium]|nr:ATP-dependent Clp protease adaptor ClpS [Bacteroidales bacterium]MBP5645292.1 ATP-dependent Clp protease adaptor ClpS [Bacteroidales bacterium]